MRAVVLYVLAWAGLSVYGGEVCPFLESLGLPRVAAVLGGAFAAAFLGRALLQGPLVSRAAPRVRPRRQFTLDLACFLAAGAALTFFDLAAYDFPLGSGLKVTFGCATIGLFAAIDLALERERAGAREAAAQREPERYFPLTRKFMVFAIAVIAMGAIDLVMIVARDLDWLAQVGADRAPAARAAATREILFVSGALLALTVNLIVSFSRNLRLFFENQTRVLDQVQGGRLDDYVPVASNDEFARIAAHTNRMIDGLKERNRIRDVFGKMVSPEIADRILERRDGLALGGSRRDLTILFSDVRGFTTRSEDSPPETVVEDLNRYFTRMVEILSRHGGIVDKFIGDGILAVFGLTDTATAPVRAVRAAREMLAAVPQLNASLSAPIRIGIGVHRGDVVAGLIGSPDRHEYTMIGDTVNTASRLESLTKELGVELLISEPVRASSVEGDWRDLGEQAIRGRREALRVFAPAATIGA